MYHVPKEKRPASLETGLSDRCLLTRGTFRLHIVCDVPDELIDFTFEWKGLKKLCVAVSFRSIIAEQKKEPEMTVRYYISSADLTAEKFATAIRNHWHVENKLHWRLDVVMNEDDCKIRRGNAAELFSGIRHIAINILTNDKVFKAGLILDGFSQHLWWCTSGRGNE